MGSTQIGGSQINKNWLIAAGGGLVMTAAVGVVTLFSGQNASGITTYKNLSDGAREQSGRLLIESGSAAFYVNPITRQIGVRTNSPKVPLEIVGMGSGSALYAATSLASSGTLTANGAVTLKALTNCTVIQTSGAGVLSCGSGASGLSQVSADARYVKKAGDTMTGGLVLAGQSAVQAALRIASGAIATSPIDGDVFQDKTKHALGVYMNGIKQFVPGVLFSSTATGAVKNTTTETTVVGAGTGSKTLPAKFFVPGKTIHLVAYGILHTHVSGPGTINMQFKLGSTAVAITGANGLPAGINDTIWSADLFLTDQTTGTAGRVVAAGYFKYQQSGTANPVFFSMKPQVGYSVNIDTTASQVVDLTATFVVADVTQYIDSWMVLLTSLN